MKRIVLLALAPLAFALAACGDDGGGGDTEAFCDDLQNLSDDVADGDLSEAGRDEVLDSFDDLLQTAAEADLDVIRQLGEDLPDDPAEAADEIQDELADLAEDCDIEEFSVAPTTTAAPATATTLEPSTTTEGSTPPTTGGGELIPVGQPQPVPEAISAEFAALADACESGDMSSCDELYQGSPSGSVDEEYGDTCGGRIPSGTGALCTNVFPGPQDVPADVTDIEAAQACFDGEMAACDSMLGSAEEADEQYGYYCGGRIDSTVASTQELCVDIFGPVAFL